MGLFLALATVVSRSAAEVAEAVAAYAAEHGLRCEPATGDIDEDERLTLVESHGHTSVLFPNHFLEWDEASRFLSQRLACAVFSFHIHDGDFWMFELFERGESVTRFNPVPDYWGETDEAELARWVGDARAIAARVPGVAVESVSPYLKRWSIDIVDGTLREKAFADDEHARGEDWQLLDFMRRLGFHAFGDKRDAQRATYRLVPLRAHPPASAAASPWWRWVFGG